MCLYVLPAFSSRCRWARSISPLDTAYTTEFLLPIRIVSGFLVDLIQHRLALLFTKDVVWLAGR